MRACLEFCAVCALAVLLAGCAGQTFAPGAAPEYLVTRDLAPLFHYGPQQGGAPEERLRRNERVRVLRREFGYSFVQARSGQTGYVANEDMKPAPPLPEPPPAAPESFPRQESFVPLPIAEEPALPKPDLDLMPADAPAEAPLPAASPAKSRS